MVVGGSDGEGVSGSGSSRTRAQKLAPPGSEIDSRDSPTAMCITYPHLEGLND